MISQKSLLVSTVILLTSVAGCSNMVESTRKSLLGDSSPRKSQTKKTKWVSKSQYDELMEKYKGLSTKYENLKDQKGPLSKSQFDKIDQLTDGNTETIDVFGQNGISSKSAPTPSASAEKNKIETDLDYYKKGRTLMVNSKFDEALKVFQFLEKSQVKQVAVRSKRYIGDIYLTKNQFDLALQVYENLLKTSSYSGVVIKALEKASFCSGKLGLKDKKAQYESMLKDFFEVRV